MKRRGLEGSGDDDADGEGDADDCEGAAEA